MEEIKIEKYKFLKIFTVIIIIFCYIVSLIFPTAIGFKVIQYNSIKQEKTFKGNILYTPESSTKTYLINNDGEIVHSWNSNFVQGLAVYLLENGDLLRSDLPYINPTFFCGGVTGRVEKFDWNGSLLWGFDYSNNQHCLHHDIEPLPNNNILMIAWEYKTAEEAIQAGRNPDTLPADKLYPDYIIEVEPTGPNSGNIVWKWHVWDHLIQDYDPSKDNYGVVADHPELIDINFGQIPLFGDWNHINSIDYNEEFDQILLSALGQDEIWIIDHSTTTEEAAGHTGGNSGKGGDILYRWGNPKAYHAGTTEDQKFFGQHDARWIDEGCPGEGNILVFNNGNGRPGFDYSSVDELVPPVDSNGSYYLEPDSSYGPKDLTWTYTADNPTNFYAPKLSGSQRIYDGNTLICDGTAGKIFEVTPEKEIVWQYLNQYPNPYQNDVFKIQHYPPEGQPEESDLDCEGRLRFPEVKTGETVNGSFHVKNIGSPGSLLNWTIASFPTWGIWSFNPESGENLSPEDGPVNVQVTIVAPAKKNIKFEGAVRIENQQDPEDFDVIPVYLKTPVNIIKFKTTFFYFSIFKKILLYLI